MTDINEMADVPMEISINGRKLKVRRPDLSGVFAELEGGLIEAEIEKIRQMAEVCNLEGSDKIEFLRQALQDVPRGATLQQLVWECLGRPEGVKMVLMSAVKKENPDITEEEIQEFITADLEMATGWTEYLCGASKKVPAVITEQTAESL